MSCVILHMPCASRCIQLQRDWFTNRSVVARRSLLTVRAIQPAATAPSAPEPYLFADDAAAGESFRSAYQASSSLDLPDGFKIKGLQEFAAAVWDRSRNIPSQSRGSTLDRIFDTFDDDGDGHLTPAEVAAALRSRHVEMTEDLARKFVEASDSHNNSTVEKGEFEALVLHMAAADLRSRQLTDAYWAKQEIGINDGMAMRDLQCDAECQFEGERDEQEEHPDLLQAQLTQQEPQQALQ